MWLIGFLFLMVCVGVVFVQDVGLFVFCLMQFECLDLWFEQVVVLQELFVVVVLFVLLFGLLMMFLLGYLLIDLVEFVLQQLLVFLIYQVLCEDDFIFFVCLLDFSFMGVDYIVEVLLIDFEYCDCGIDCLIMLCVLLFGVQINGGVLMWCEMVWYLVYWLCDFVWFVFLMLLGQLWFLGIQLGFIY